MTTFSKHYLGKPIELLEFTADVEPFIRREVSEGQNLEYKSAGSALSEHGDVISAFLNSGGGLLIIGTPREVENALPGGRIERVCHGPFTPLPAISKDDARRSLLSKVNPLPASIRVNPVLCSGGCVIVVDVESSDYPPHQHDGTYWVRLDGEMRKAPHAFVEALFLQRRGPNLDCKIQVVRGLAVDSPDSLDRWELELQLNLINSSRNIAEFCALDLKTDPTMSPKPDGLRLLDPQPGDALLQPVQDEGGRRLYRYRLRGDVLHAYEWKGFESRFHIARSFDQGTTVEFTIDLQAKDMLRKRLNYEIDLGAIRRGQKIEPARVESIDAPPF